MIKAFAITYVVALALALASTPLAKRIAAAVGLLDMPGPRKVHGQPTPRCGGIAIVVSMVTAIAAAMLSSDMAWNDLLLRQRQMFGLSAGAALLLVAGLIDDARGLSGQVKLLLLLLAGFVTCASGVVLDVVSLGGGIEFRLGWVGWPLTMLWIALVTVSINFIDGLDGLAAGIAVVVAVVLSISAVLSGTVVTALVSVALAGSLCGFLVFNCHPARIFMGDGGSMLVGYLLAVGSVHCVANGEPFCGFIAPTLALSVPLFDTLLTFARRSVLQRRSIFAAEHGHIHHRLLKMGLSHPMAVSVLHGTTLLCATVGLWVLSRRGGAMHLSVAGAFALLILLFLFVVGGALRREEWRRAVSEWRAMRTKAKHCRRAYEDAQLALQTARDLPGWWAEVCKAAERLELARVIMPLRRRNGQQDVWTWEAAGYDRDMPHGLAVSIPVPDRRYGGCIEMEAEASVQSGLELGGLQAAYLSRLVAGMPIAKLPPAAPCPAVPMSEHEANIQPVPREVEPVGPAARLGQRQGRDGGLVEFGGDGLKLGSPRKVAVVHDFLYCYAGAERVLEQILKVYPEADLFCLFDFLPPSDRGFLQNKPSYTTLLQRMPLVRKVHRAYLPLMPLAVEQLDLSTYDLVVSSSYMAAKGVLTGPDQLHICYCHTPARCAWDLQQQYLAEAGMLKGMKSLLARLILHYIRGWDSRSANGVDVFVANSHFVQRRIRKTYRRAATTIYPPVDVDKLEVCAHKEDFFLTVSRLVPYKRIDLLVSAFKHLPDRRLIVIGDGPERRKLQAMAGPNVTLLGHQPTAVVHRLMRFARAFLFAAEEDFGIVAVEAQACGTPVLAFGHGGQTESILDGITGLFFHEQSVESILAVIRDFENRPTPWNPRAIRANAERYSAERFREQFRELVESYWLAFTSECQEMPRTRLLAGAAPSPQLAGDVLDTGSGPAAAASLA